MEQALRSGVADIAEISLNTMPNRLLSVAGDSSSEFVSADDEAPGAADRRSHVTQKENVAPATTPAARPATTPQQSREEKEAAERQGIRRRLKALKTQLKTEMPLHTTAATAKTGTELLGVTASDDVAHPSLLSKRKRKRKNRRKISAGATDDTPPLPRAKLKKKRNRKKVRVAMRLPEAGTSTPDVDVVGTARVARNRPYKRSGRRHKRKGGTATPARV